MVNKVFFKRQQPTTHQRVSCWLCIGGVFLTFVLTGCWWYAHTLAARGGARMVVGRGSASPLVMGSGALMYGPSKGQIVLPLAAGARPFEATWEACLWVRRTGTYRFWVHHDGELSLAINHTSYWNANPDFDEISESFDVELAAGSHLFEMSYRDYWNEPTLEVRSDLLGSQQVLDARVLTDPACSDGCARWLRWWAGNTMLFGCFTVVAWTVLLAWWAPWCGRWMAESRYREVGWVLLVMCVGGALRWYAVWKSGFQVQADEAIGSLMGLHIAKGEAFPLFFYGQDYMGAFQAWLQAPLYFLTDWSGAVIHRVVAVVLAMIPIPLLYVVAKHIAGAQVAALAIVYVACGAVMPVVYGLLGMAGSVEMQAFGLVLVWLAVRLIWDNQWQRADYYFWMGLLGGFAFYVNGQIVYYLVPIAFMLLLRRPLIWLTPQFWLGPLAFVIGVTPMICYDLGNNWAALRLLGATSASGGAWQVFQETFLGHAVPLILGTRVRWYNTMDLSLGMLPWIVYIVMGCAFVGVCSWCLYRTIARRSFPPSLVMIPVVFVWVMVLYSCSRWGRFSHGGTGDGRYLVSVVPLIAMVWAWWVVQVGKRAHVLVGSFCAVTPLMLALGSWYLSDPGLFFQPVHYLYEGKYVPQNLQPLIEYLDEHQLDAVYTDYWIGYPLMLETRERIAVDTQFDRWEAPRLRVMQSERPAYVFPYNHPHAPGYHQVFMEAGYQGGNPNGFLCYFPQRRHPPRARWTARGNVFHLSIPLRYAIDGDLEGSSWYDNVPGREDNKWLEIDLGKSVHLDQVLLVRTDSLGGPYHLPGYGPADGQLRVSFDRQVWSEPFEFVPVSGYDRADQAHCGGQLARYLRIEQTESSPDGPWAIHEVLLRIRD